MPNERNTPNEAGKDRKPQMGSDSNRNQQAQQNAPGTTPGNKQQGQNQVRQDQQSGGAQSGQHRQEGGQRNQPGQPNQTRTPQQGGSQQGGKSDQPGNRDRDKR